MQDNPQNIIIYNTDDGKASVSLLARDGQVWLNQQLLAELFDTSVPNVSMHISNVLNEGELDKDSVIKDYLTTAADGKNYQVTFYIAKNYLTAKEIDRLNRFVSVFLETAELRAQDRQDITMAFWRENVDKILLLNDKAILSGKGTVSNAQMETFVDKVYQQFDFERKKYEAFLADAQDLKELEEIVARDKPYQR